MQPRDEVITNSLSLVSSLLVEEGPTPSVECSVSCSLIRLFGGGPGSVKLDIDQVIPTECFTFQHLGTLWPICYSINNGIDRICMYTVWIVK